MVGNAFFHEYDIYFLMLQHMFSSIRFLFYPSWVLTRNNIVQYESLKLDTLKTDKESILVLEWQISSTLTRQLIQERSRYGHARLTFVFKYLSEQVYDKKIIMCKITFHLT